MNDEQKQALWLSDIFKQIAEGGQRQITKPERGYQNTPLYPHINSEPSHWRMKPQRKVIDMSVLVGREVDCEFWDGTSGVPKYGYLEVLAEQVTFPYGLFNSSMFKHCTPRMNKWMHHDGGECPVPEGFEIKVKYRNGDFAQGDIYPDSWPDQENEINDNDIAAYMITGKLDDYRYEWEDE